MIKKILLLVCMLFALNVYAGELENAINANDYVFLYMHTPNCGYCKKFNPIYENLVKTYGSEITFVKIDASNRYGFNIMRSYNARYVPFVVLIKSKERKGWQVDTRCLLDNACINKTIKEFKNK